MLLPGYRSIWSRICKTQETVLSVGCGPGVFLRELAAIRPSAEFVGVDLSAERIHEGEARLRGVSTLAFK